MHIESPSWHRTRHIAVFAASVLALTLLLPAAAPADSDTLLKVQERAKYLNDYKALLEHSDPTVRAAAIDEALKGDDPQLRSMALESALASKDQRLQTTALRWLFKERDKLPVSFVLPEKPDAAQEYVYNTWHGLVLEDIKINEKTDEITVKSHRFAGGNLTRGGFKLTFANGSIWTCVLDANVASGTLLTGSMSCTIGRKQINREAPATRSSLPIRIDLS